ncbi:MAG: M20/M25/M40 family metallo-hydrolase [Planctomycetes bacterium]|nr:M20/M25/M40 family metallo-hydrolase [Planctomycetota bacterium]
MPPSNINRAHLTRWIKDHRASFESELRELVEIPSISMDPSRKGDIRRCADAAAALIRAAGGTAEILETVANPIVQGAFLRDPSFPTVTIYNHMDVQPADEPTWKQDPFRMSNVDGTYGGRGTTDDKGPALTAFYAARYAVEQNIPVNIRFLWELEEEIGSPSFEGCLKANAGKLTTNSVVVSDTVWIARGKPAVSTGLRGMVTALLSLETGTEDRHSGLVGGLARNPLAELAEVIAGCVDARSGKVLIEGFYKNVQKPKKSELDGFLASGFRTSQFQKVHGFKSLRTRDHKAGAAAIWALPTFEVHGITGGYQGPGVKSVVPPRGEVKISMRLVPNQTPQEALKLLTRHVKKLNKDVVVKGQHGLLPYRGPSDGPLADAAVESLRFAFGKKPAFVREGGSIGAVVTMEQVLKCPIMFIGLSLPEHGYHAPNENYDWGQASGGMVAFTRYFELLSQKS